jgi:hypothetical protein
LEDLRRRWDETFEIYFTELVDGLDWLASLQISTTSGGVSETSTDFFLGQEEFLSNLLLDSA